MSGGWVLHEHVSRVLPGSAVMHTCMHMGKGGKGGGTPARKWEGGGGGDVHLHTYGKEGGRVCSCATQCGRPPPSPDPTSATLYQGLPA